MPGTLSVSPIDANEPDGILRSWTTEMVGGIVSLEQRIAQRLRFPIGGHGNLDTRRGTESVIGREFTPSLAAGVISAAIRDEGGSEITDIVDVTAVIDMCNAAVPILGNRADNLRRYAR